MYADRTQEWQDRQIDRVFRPYDPDATTRCHEVRCGGGLKETRLGGHPRVSFQSPGIVLSGNADRIAEAEHRDRSELVRFLIDWSIAQYDQVGSLGTLLTSKVITSKK
jgi:hypothetical protein